VPARAIKPPCKAGRNPQLTKEDLPLPDVPTTAKKRVAASLSTMASTWFSRPKNKYSSSSLNGLRPGNGFLRFGGSCCVHLVAPLGFMACTKVVIIVSEKISQAINQVRLFHLDQIFFISRLRIGQGKYKKPTKASTPVSPTSFSFHYRWCASTPRRRRRKEDDGVSSSH